MLPLFGLDLAVALSPLLARAGQHGGKGYSARWQGFASKLCAMT